MNGNPHYGDGRAAGVYYATRTLATDADVIALAQTEATLALAFEQRTANLVASYSLAANLIMQGGEFEDGGREKLADLNATIEARLGLNGDAS